MSVFKIFYSSYKWLSDNDERNPLGYWKDPLRHPDIARMDQRMLGDLPMPVLPRRDFPVHETASANSKVQTPCPAAKPVRQCDPA